MFFVVILMSCVLFGGFFIDSARILTAKREVKNAMNTAARSTLAYYDETIIGEYGLYAFDGTKANERFKRYFENNLVKSKSDGLNFVTYTVENINVVPQEPLTGDELTRQITEYEKYRGPVNITIGVIDKLKQVFSNKNTDKITTATDAVDKITKNFKDSGNTMKRLRSTLKETVKNDLKGIVTKEVKNLTSNWIENGMKTELEKQYEKAEKSIKETKELLKKLKKEREDYYNAAASVTGADQSSVDETAKQYTDGTESVLKQMDDKIATLENEISQAETKLASIKTTISKQRTKLLEKVRALEKKRAELDTAKQDKKNAESRRSAAQTDLNNAQTALESAQNYAATKKQYTDKITDLQSKNDTLAEIVTQQRYDIYNDEDWKHFCELVEKENRTKEENELIIQYKIQSKGAETELVNEMIDNYIEMVDVKKQLANLKAPSGGNSITQLQNAVNAAQNRWNAEDNEVKRLEGVITKLENDIVALENEIKGIQAIMSSAVDELNNLSLSDVGKVKVPSLRKKIKEFAEEAAEYSNLLSNLSKLGEKLTKKMPEKKVLYGSTVDTEETGILKTMTSIKNNITALINICTNAEKLRNEMYYIDYVMNKCTYLTSQTSRSHFFEAAEVEYIIFGLDNQAANVTAAVASIYGIRLIINAFDYFINPTENASPELISRIALAIGRGAVQAGIDVFNMVIAADDEAAGCDLCPTLKDLNLKFSYSDHLRIFLLLNSGNTRQLLTDSMAATLNEKKGPTMSSMFTKLNAEVRVKVNLLFLPIFGSDLLSGTVFDGGSYVIYDQVVEGYE